MILQGIKKPETEEEKKMVADAQQPKKDPQADLIAGLTAQAQSEATKFASQARNLDTDSVQNLAGAEKTQAETLEIMAGIETSQIKALNELRKQAFEEAKALPFGAS
jgi:hypothetical protein